jgi:hypothetical protein
MTPAPCCIEQLPRFTAVVVVARCVGFSDSGIGITGLGPGGFMIHEAGVSVHRVRTT